jgi:hypothetical protein
VADAGGPSVEAELDRGIAGRVLLAEVRQPTADVRSRSRSSPPSRISRTASGTDLICSPTAIGTLEAARTSGSRPQWPAGHHQSDVLVDRRRVALGEGRAANTGRSVVQVRHELSTRFVIPAGKPGLGPLECASPAPVPGDLI